MTKHRQTLPLLLIASLAGCSSRWTETQNYNNGAEKILSFDAPYTTISMDDSVSIVVHRQEAGTYDCTSSLNINWANSGGGGGKSCVFTGARLSVEAILAARCDGGSCEARFGTVADGPLGVTVMPRIAGATQLQVTARLSDGSVVEDRFVLQLVGPVDAIAVTCWNGDGCAGPHAMLVGATVQWGAALTSGGVGVAAPLSMDVSPAGVVQVVPSPENHPFVRDPASPRALTLTAIGPGVATIRFRAGAVDVVEQVRVVKDSEVVRGELRQKAVGVETLSGNPVSTDLVGAALQAPIGERGVSLAVVWVLADGSLAVGGAGRMKADAPAHVATRAPDDLANVFNYIQLPASFSGKIPVSVTAGAAKLVTTIDVKIP